MVFVCGPRQVGKTTIATQICTESDYCKYLNWDKNTDRSIILANNEQLLEDLPIDAILQNRPLIVFDKRTKSLDVGLVCGERYRRKNRKFCCLPFAKSRTPLE